MGGLSCRASFEREVPNPDRRQPLAVRHYPSPRAQDRHPRLRDLASRCWCAHAIRLARRGVALPSGTRVRGEAASRWRCWFCKLVCARAYPRSAPLAWSRRALCSAGGRAVALPSGEMQSKENRSRRRPFPARSQGTNCPAAPRVGTVTAIWQRKGRLLVAKKLNRRTPMTWPFESAPIATFPPIPMAKTHGNSG